MFIRYGSSVAGMPEADLSDVADVWLLDNWIVLLEF